MRAGGKCGRGLGRLCMLLVLALASCLASPTPAFAQGGGQGGEQGESVAIRSDSTFARLHPAEAREFDSLAALPATHRSFVALAHYNGRLRQMENRDRARLDSIEQAQLRDVAIYEAFQGASIPWSMVPGADVDSAGARPGSRRGAIAGAVAIGSVLAVNWSCPGGLCDRDHGGYVDVLTVHQPDKITHAAMGATTYMALRSLGAGPKSSALLTAIGIVGWEVTQARGGGYPSRPDVYAGAIGLGAGLAWDAFSHLIGGR